MIKIAGTANNTVDLDDPLPEAIENKVGFQREDPVPRALECRIAGNASKTKMPASSEWETQRAFRCFLSFAII